MNALEECSDSPILSERATNSQRLSGLVGPETWEHYITHPNNDVPSAIRVCKSALLYMEVDVASYIWVQRGARQYGASPGRNECMYNS